MLLTAKLAIFVFWDYPR